MDAAFYIDITGADTADIVRAAYDLSRPQGMGFLHFKPAPLTDNEVKAIVEPAEARRLLHMDYVNGRAVKLSVIEKNDRKYIPRSWYDHGKHDLQELLKRIGKPELVELAQ